MANELKFGSKVVFLNGQPLTLPIAASDPGSATAGDLYYNSVSNLVRFYDGSVWATLGSTGANTALSNLASVAINTSLLPGVDNSVDLGSSTFSWASANIHTLKDSAGLSAISPYSRTLVDSSGATQLSWSASGVDFNQLTPSTVPYINASNILTSSTVTPTELGYLSGVTSAIQTQLNGKQATGSYITALTGDVTATGPGSVASTVAKIQGTTVSGTTGTTNVVFSASPTLTGTISAAALTMSGLLTVSTIASTGTMLLNANSGASPVNIESTSFGRSTDGTNFVTMTYNDSITLTDNSGPTSVTAFQFAFASFGAEEISYTIKTGAATSDVRVGTIRVTSNSDGSITSISDMFTESADVGVTWTASLSGSNILVSYTATNLGTNRTMRSDIKQFRR